MGPGSARRGLFSTRPAAGIALAAALSSGVAGAPHSAPDSASDSAQVAAGAEPASSPGTSESAIGPLEAAADPPVAVADAVSRRTLRDPQLTDVARRLLSSAENSSLDWEAQYGYIEYDVERDVGENRGYTGGLVGFTSKTHDMREVVRRYARAVPSSTLAGYLPALIRVDGTASATGLGPQFETAWREAAHDERFRAVQRDLVEEIYFGPAVDQATADGLGPLGQFAYFDALVVHGPGTGPVDFGGIREAAHRRATPPSAGGNEQLYLEAFLDARTWAMRQERAHADVSRVEDAQRRFLREGNVDLRLPLSWTVYGDQYRLP